VLIPDSENSKREYSGDQNGIPENPLTIQLASESARPDQYDCSSIFGTVDETKS
jgi:hypothetical protein